MKREDLIRRLENTEPPQAELPGCQQRLKTALLQADYLHRRQRGAATLELAKSILKGAKDAMIRSLISRQPVWKTATVAVLAVALVLGLSLTIPPLTTDSVYAQAAEIAQNSPEVLTAVGEVGEIQVIDVSETEGTVIAQGENGSVMAKVNLETREVTEMVNLTIDEQAAIEIAEADARVQALLDDGATIGGVSTMYIQGVTGNVATGEFEEFCEAWVTVEIAGSDGTTYAARVDLDAGEVVSITQTAETEAIPIPEAGTGAETIPDPAVDGS
jgi:hypothetical protein